MSRSSGGALRPLLFLCVPLLLAVGAALYAALSLEVDPGPGDEAAEQTEEGTETPRPPKDDGDLRKPGERGPPEVDPAVAAQVFGVVRLYRTKEPVKDLVLELRPEQQGPPWRVKTGADGSFRFRAVLPAAGYELHGALEPYAPLAVTGIDLEPKARHDLGVLWLALPVDLPVEVVDHAGKPIEGAEVRLFRGETVATAAAQAWSGWDEDRDRKILALTSPEKPTRSASTGADGKVVVQGLFPGTYRVNARAAGHAQESRDGVVVAPDAATLPVRLVLGPGHRLEGTVTDPKGDGVAGARVIASRGDGWQPGADRWITESDDTGRYELSGLAASRITLYLARQDKPLLQVGSFGVPETTRFDIRLRPGGTIRGTVTGEDGSAVEGAEIRAAMEGTWSPMSTVTDAEGKYVLEDVPAGPLAYFRVTAEGHVPYPDPSAPQQGAGESLSESQEMVRDVVLQSGLAADLVVLSSTGGPVADARVQMFLSPPGMGGESRPWSGATDEEGRVRVAGLVPGNYLVRIVAPGHVQPGMPPWFMNVLQSPEALPEAWRLLVEPGAAASATYTLTAGATVSGVVRDARSDPVAGAQVQVEGSQSEFPVFTDSEGRFKADCVAPSGRVVATASAPGHPPGRSEPFEVTEGAEVKDIEILLRPGATVVGNVRSASGEPLRGAMVRVVNGKLEEGNPWGFQAFDQAERWPVDPNGGFRITGVPVDEQGVVTVRADAEGHLPSWDNDVRVAVEQETGGVNIILTAALEIAGRVESTTGEKVGGAMVHAQYRGTAQQRAWQFVTGTGGNPVAQTDGSGRFVLKGLKEGNYQLWAQAPGFSAGNRVSTQTGAGDVLLSLAEGKSISGRLVDEEGRPMPGLPVTAQKTDRSADQEWWWWGGSQAYSGPDGTFEIRDLADGVYDLTVSAMWQWGRDVNVEDTKEQGVSAGRDDVEIVVHAGRVIEGSVKDWSGTPVRSGWVSAQFEASDGNSWRDSRWGRMNADGTFRLAGLRAGSYTVWVYGAFKPNQQKGVASGTKNVEIEVEPSLVLGGRVLDPGGLTLAAGYNVRIRKPGTENWQWTQVVMPGDGTFLLLAIGEGAWDVEVNAQGFAPKVIENVTAGRRDLLVKLETGVAMAGTVVGPGGQPLSGARVTATQINVPAGASAASRSGQTDEQGAFLIEGLAEGEYQVRVWMREHAPAVIQPVGGNSQGVKFVMETGVTLSGTVRDENGAVPQNVRLQFVSTDDLHTLRARLDNEGRFEMKNVPTGFKWKVSGQMWDGSAWSHTEHEGEIEPKGEDVAIVLKPKR